MQVHMFPFERMFLVPWLPKAKDYLFFYPLTLTLGYEARNQIIQRLVGAMLASENRAMHLHTHPPRAHLQRHVMMRVSRFILSHIIANAYLYKRILLVPRVGAVKIRSNDLIYYDTATIFKGWTIESWDPDEKGLNI